MTIIEVLQNIQTNLKAPKNQFNKFGGYNYRNCEDILNALKPLLAEHKAAVVITDEIVEHTDRIYVKATATLHWNGETISATASAREPLTKKGMDEAQITGATSSYARKYALNGLFAIDDTKDADNFDNTQGDTPIDKQNIMVIESLAKETETDINKLLANYKVEEISKLTMSQAYNAIGILNKKRLKK